MKNRASSRTGLFLMELILAVLFFALAGSVCIQLFVKSHAISERSVELNNSVLWTQNVSEAFYGCNGNVSKMASLFEGCSHSISDDGSAFLNLYFDKNFKPYTEDALTESQIQNGEYSYILHAYITPPDDKGLLSCNISIFETTEKDNIYELSISLFPEKEAHDE